MGTIKITRGRQAAPVKLVAYGVEGIGKTTLASQCPNPLILDTEDGSKRLDVARVSVPDWQSLTLAVRELAVDRQGFETIVIDSIDWAERACKEWTCKQHGKKSLEDWPYGKGHVLFAETFATLLDACDRLCDTGLHVVLVAHTKVVKTSPPDQTEGFDRWELDLDKRTAPSVKEWADAVLFLNYRMRIIEGSDGRSKGIGGKDRVIYAERSAAYDAKNRFGLPPEMPMAFEHLAPMFAPQPVAAAAKPKPGWRELVTDAQTVEALGDIGDRVDAAESQGKLTPEQARKLRDLIDFRHNELEPAEASA